MREFAVGQEFLVVWSRRRTSEPESFDTYTISKIGRDWVYFVNYGRTYRFSKSSMNVDGGSYSSPGRVYLKQSDYHDEVAMNQAWSELEKLVRGNYRPPEHLCLDKIKQCIALLKPPVSNDPKQ